MYTAATGAMYIATMTAMYTAATAAMYTAAIRQRIEQLWVAAIRQRIEHLHHFQRRQESPPQSDQPTTPFSANLSGRSQVLSRVPAATQQ